MTPRPYSRSTAYGEWVSTKIRVQILTYHGLYCTTQELADACSVKPTHNFRRLINNLAADGDIEKFLLPSARGGIMALYAKKGSAPPNELAIRAARNAELPVPKYPRNGDFHEKG